MTDTAAIDIRPTGAGAGAEIVGVDLSQPLDDATLLRAFLSYPLMSLKVIAGIHWHALKLWRRGAKLQPRPQAPTKAVTIVRPMLGRAAE